MSKVTIVQIAMSPYDGDIWTEYLDDQGRVWHDAGRNVIDKTIVNGDGSKKNVYKWVSKWELVNLPDEPTE